MSHTRFSEHAGELLAFVHACRAHEYRLPLFVTGYDIGHNLAVLGLFIPINQVRLVFSNHRFVGRNCHYSELVGAHELRGFRLCGTGHARDLAVEPEVVLQCHRSERLVFRFDFNGLFGLNRLVDSLVVPPAREDTAGVLVDNQDLAVHHDIVLVALEKCRSF